MKSGGSMKELEMWERMVPVLRKQPQLLNENPPKKNYRGFLATKIKSSISEKNNEIGDIYWKKKKRYGEKNMKTQKVTNNLIKSNFDKIENDYDFVKNKRFMSDW